MKNEGTSAGALRNRVILTALLPALLMALVAAGAAPATDEGSGSGGAPTAGGPVKGGDTGRPLDTGYREEVRVDLVQLNFLAVDKRGNPVTDLRMDEIEIFDGGERQDIAFLQHYYQERRSPSGAPPVQVTIPDGTGEGAAAGTTAGDTGEEAAGDSAEGATSQMAAGESAGGGASAGDTAEAATAADLPLRPGVAVTPGRWIVLMIDLYSTGPSTRLKSADAVRDFVRADVKEGDQVAIVAFTGKIQLLQSFTSNQLDLIAACGKIGGLTDRAADDRWGNLQSLMDTMENCRGNSLPYACAERFAGAYEDTLLREADSFMKALTLLTRSLAAIPDIKTLVLFSDGFSRNPSSDSFDAATVSLGLNVARAMAPRPNWKIERAYDDLAEAAASARVSIFTINPGANSRRSAVHARRRAPLSELSNPLQIDPFQRSEMNFQQGLVELARRTGGTASTTPEVLKSLKSVVDLAPGLYSVGYYPSGEAGGGRIRDVKIKVTRKGVEVESRREVPLPEVIPPLRGELSLSPEPCVDEARRIVVMKMIIDRSRLSFEKVDQEFSSNFSIYVRFLTEDSIEPLYQNYHFFNITNTREEFAAGELPDPTFEQTLTVPCRPLTVLITVSDATSGARGDFTATVSG